MSKINEVLEIVKGMSVLELNDLVKAFEEEFGVSAAAPGGCCCPRLLVALLLRQKKNPSLM